MLLGFLLFQRFPIEEKLTEFIMKVTLYSSLSGTYNSLRRPLVELQLHLDALREELNLEWNLDRRVSNIRREEEGPLTSQVLTEIKEANSKKVEKRKKSMGDNDFETPSKKGRKVICVFKRASPKSELVEKLPCHICPKQYSSKKALVKHLKMAHDGAVIDEQIKGQPDRITCKICNRKSRRDLINRHLNEVHGMAKT